MAHAASRRAVAAQSRFRALVSPCGICGGQSGTATGFSPSYSVFPYQYNSTVSLYYHVSSEGLTIGPLEAAFQRHRLAPSK
jgi:hypothetical protein